MSLAIPYTCRHCKKVFYGPSITKTVFSQAEAIETEAFSQKINHHLQTEHQAIMQQAMLSLGAFQGMLVFSQFRAEGLSKQVDLQRWTILQYVLKKHFSDEDLGAWVDRVTPDLVGLAKAGDTVTLRKNLLGMLQSIRDVLEEPNKYPGGVIPKEDTTLVV